MIFFPVFLSDFVSNLITPSFATVPGMHLAHFVPYCSLLSQIIYPEGDLVATLFRRLSKSIINNCL